MGRATEQIAERVGEGLGGLLNATFGNAAEVIIAVMALRAGESHWMEGVQLLAVYVILGIAFFFLPH
jgi:Ca2+/H+ antiporter